MLKQNSICLFYFPLKIMIVDDNTDYLILCKNKIHLNQIYTSSQPLNIVDNMKPISINIKSLVKEWVDSEFSIDYAAIIDFIMQYDLSNDIGILITDYKMPEINGIDLCKKFDHTDLLKVLLTGEYQIEEAIDALNDKHIDYYIPKKLDNKLIAAIENLQYKFFNHITYNICQIINTSDLPFISNKDFLAIFNDIICDNSIISYVMLNNYGCCYLKSTTNEFILSIYSETDIDELSIEYSNSSQIKTKQMIPSARSLLMNDVEFITCSYSNNYYYNLEDVTNIKLPWNIEV